MTPQKLHPNDPKGASGLGKAQLHLLPRVAMIACSNVMRLGAQKYGAHNFRDAQVLATTYVSAIMRHMAAWNDGEDIDPESGESHIAHIMANCCIVLDAMAHNTLLDDRWKPTQEGLADALFADLPE